MLTPHPPRPPYPPPGAGAGESDESLAAPLRAGSDSEASRSAALLMARHWQPAQDYAAICLATPGTLAHMVTAAAFHQILDRLVLGETADALRPRLLLAVRDTVANWSAEDRISEVLPDLQKPAGGRGMRATKSMTPENRALAERSFQGLVPMAQCLLWHTAVEAESINVPAALLGMDADSAAFALEQAREKFREGCVRAHRELAPSKDCRFYNRLLDVPIRRGGALLPDVQRHLTGCRYCRHAAEQLGHVENGLGLLLAEAVLGWGGRRYLDSRPGRGRPAGARGRGASRHGGGRPHAGARHRLLARIPLSARRAPGAVRSSRALLTGVGIAGAGLLATVLAVGAWPDGGDGTDPVASTSASGARRTLPGADTQAPPAVTRQTRLRNAESGLCLDIKGGPEPGAGVVLAVCTSSWTQQWTYEDDGLLRSVAGADLCLDSHADAGVVILGTCADTKNTRGDDVRYDLTVHGELLPRWDETLALAATGRDPGAEAVVKVRDRSAGERWLTDPVPATDGSLSIGGTGRPPARAAELSDRVAGR
ncbi:RICIN domain-containing protein [Streptomyces brasiliensis]|uniref:Hydrolase n=1 Tax=Streptomyces brasiliensis TaxID=1954 RepID=A0A917NF36_9ACTN|nr:RICIN domain-containing protein [Streptomyces brasiliensis]GGI97015.1 hydrolase [Streptomyces brasiliensis]